ALGVEDALGEEAPDACPREAPVVVHRILGPARDPGRAEGGAEPGPGHAQQRTEQPAMPQLAHAAHRGEALDAAAALEAQEERLGLIVPVMGDEEVEAAARAAPGVERAVAGLARRRLQVAYAERRGQVQRRLLEAALGAVAGDQSRLLGGFGAERVIDGQ